MSAQTATVIDVFAGRPEARTSYSNQRGLAARDLGAEVECIHGETLADGCLVCRMSGSVLIPADTRGENACTECPEGTITEVRCNRWGVSEYECDVCGAKR